VKCNVGLGVDPNCNEGLCFDPCFRVFHTKSQSRPTPHKEKQITQSLSNIFHYVWIFFNTQYIVLYNKVNGVWILWKGEKISWDVFIGFILTFCGPTKKEQTTTLWKLFMCQEFMIYKCHRNVTKQTNPLQEDNLLQIHVAILEAYGRILNTQCVKT
jgi:hypothetical protein